MRWRRHSVILWRLWLRIIPRCSINSYGLFDLITVVIDIIAITFVTRKVSVANGGTYQKPVVQLVDCLPQSNAEDNKQGGFLFCSFSEWFTEKGVETPRGTITGVPESHLLSTVSRNLPRQTHSLRPLNEVFRVEKLLQSIKNEFNTIL